MNRPLSRKQHALSCMTPKPCPAALIRLGGDKDGAYLVPDDLEGIKACFSPGVSNIKTFEDDLSTNYGIRCHLCDFSSDEDKLKTPLIKGMQTFEKKWLDIDGGDNSISLAEWVADHAPDPKDDLILQIDIEGAEYRNLLASSDELLTRFRIIVIELHNLKAFRNEALLAKEVAPLLEKLNRNHTCVHAHPNNCCGEFLDQETGLNIPLVIELTYLRHDRLLADADKHIDPQLPHPLDIDWNTRTKPPLHLNDQWLAPRPRSDPSKIKMLTEELTFAKQQLSLIRAETAEVAAIQVKALSNLYLNASAASSPPASNDEAKPFRSQDLALGKPFFLSTNYRGCPAEGVVEESSKFFFHTGLGTNQSITIDLLDDYRLGQLAIRNRLDGCQSRAAHLFWICHGNPTPTTLDEFYPVITSAEFLENGRAESITPLLGKRGRYLTVFSPFNTALHFSALRIFHAEG
jgi:hypothetical protein